MPSEVSTTKIIARLVIGIIVVSTMLFGSAGTINWPEAWLYIILQFSFSTALAAWLKKNNPDLLKERLTFLKKSAKSWDKVIMLTGTIIFIPYLLLPGIDAVKYRWSQIATPIKAAGFAAIIASFILIFYVMRENTYLSRVVEIQKDRGHKVITTGPYRYVRHPMYVGVIILFISIPLALGSLFALVPGAALTIIIIIRTHLEDKTLQAELQGYKAYTEKVRYRLIPGIW